MMLSGTELILLVVIIAVTFAFHKLRAISRGIALLRLRFDKGISEEYIEVIAAESKDDDQ